MNYTHFSIDQCLLQHNAWKNNFSESQQRISNIVDVLSDELCGNVKLIALRHLRERRCFLAVVHSVKYSAPMVVVVKNTVLAELISSYHVCVHVVFYE